MNRIKKFSLLQLLEADTDGSGDLSPDELRDLADDLEGEPLTGEDLRDALISAISDMHKDIYGRRANATALRQLSTEELELEHDKIEQQHKDWWYEERHREDQDMWIADEERETEELSEPEEGEDLPKFLSMRRSMRESASLSRDDVKGFLRTALTPPSRSSLIVEDSPLGDGLVSVETALREKLISVGVPEMWVEKVVDHIQSENPLDATAVAQIDTRGKISQDLKIIEKKWSKAVETDWGTWKPEHTPREVVDQVASIVRSYISG